MSEIDKSGLVHSIRDLLRAPEDGDIEQLVDLLSNVQSQLRAISAETRLSLFDLVRSEEIEPTVWKCLAEKILLIVSLDRFLNEYSVSADWEIVFVFALRTLGFLLSYRELAISFPADLSSRILNLFVSLLNSSYCSSIVHNIVMFVIAEQRLDLAQISPQSCVASLISCVCTYFLESFRKHAFPDTLQSASFQQCLRSLHRLVAQNSSSSSSNKSGHDNSLFSSVSAFPSVLLVVFRICFSAVRQGEVGNTEKAALSIARICSHRFLHSIDLFSCAESSSLLEALRAVFDRFKMMAEEAESAQGTLPPPILEYVIMSLSFLLNVSSTLSVSTVLNPMLVLFQESLIHIDTISVRCMLLQYVWTAYIDFVAFREHVHEWGSQSGQEHSRHKILSRLLKPLQYAFKNFDEAQVRRVAYECFSKISHVFSSCLDVSALDVAHDALVGGNGVLKEELAAWVKSVFAEDINPISVQLLKELENSASVENLDAESVELQFPVALALIRQIVSESSFVTARLPFSYAPLICNVYRMCRLFMSHPTAGLHLSQWVYENRTDAALLEPMYAAMFASCRLDSTTPFSGPHLLSVLKVGILCFRQSIEDPRIILERILEMSRFALQNIKVLFGGPADAMSRFSQEVFEILDAKISTTDVLDAGGICFDAFVTCTAIAFAGNCFGVLESQIKELWDKFVGTVALHLSKNSPEEAVLTRIEAVCCRFDFLEECKEYLSRLWLETSIIAAKRPDNSTPDARIRGKGITRSVASPVGCRRTSESPHKKREQMEGMESFTSPVGKRIRLAILSAQHHQHQHHHHNQGHTHAAEGECSQIPEGKRVTFFLPQKLQTPSPSIPPAKDPFCSRDAKQEVLYHLRAAHDEILQRSRASTAMPMMAMNEALEASQLATRIISFVHASLARSSKRIADHSLEDRS
eukprot:ANDGO_08325.mRNA.1 hypothetical protein